LEILQDFFLGLQNAKEELLDGSLHSALRLRGCLTWNPVLLPIGSSLIPPILSCFLNFVFIKCMEMRIIGFHMVARL